MDNCGNSRANTCDTGRDRSSRRGRLAFLRAGTRDGRLGSRRYILD